MKEIMKFTNYKQILAQFTLASNMGYKIDRIIIIMIRVYDDDKSTIHPPALLRALDLNSDFCKML